LVSESKTGRDGGVSERDYQVTMMFHPCHYVPDLSEAEEFYQRVFGEPSTPMSSIMTNPVNRSNDYSTFTLIREVYFDSIDPDRLVVDGVHPYPDIHEPHLGRISWYASGMPELFRELKRHGIRVVDRKFRVIESDEAPTPITNFYLSAEDAGLRYSILPHDIFPADPRTDPTWTLPPVGDDDPLGLDFCLYHTILTSRPERVSKLIIGVLGGTVFHEGRDEIRGTTATYVQLADAVLQIAVPDAGTEASKDLESQAPDDSYHAITWKVVDLDRTARGLEASGVRIKHRFEDALITDPATTLGIPFGFTTSSVPGDPRG
jgi:hypothetical protein